MQTHLGQEEVVAPFPRGVDDDSCLISRKGDVLPSAIDQSAGGENMNWISNDPSELVHRDWLVALDSIERERSTMSAAMRKSMNKTDETNEP